MTPIQVEWVRRLPANLLVPYYLMSSYLYYHCDSGPMTDQAYDLCCKRLEEEWFWIEHPHKHLVDFDSLASTTGYYLRPESLPRIVLLSAHTLMQAVETGVIADQLQPIINRQEGTIVSNITIAAINERLNLGLTAKFIEEELGIAPVEKVKKSMLWTEDQYQEIIDALGAHIERARHSKAAAPAKDKKVKDEPKPEETFDFGTDEPAADEGFFGGDEPAEEESFFG